MNDKFIKSTSYGGVTFRYSRGKSLAYGKELHPHHEILYYIDGDAEFLSTECHKRPEPKTLFVIPKERFHNFIIGNEERYTRLTIAFSDSALPKNMKSFLSEIKVIEPSDKLSALFDSMCDRMSHSAELLTTPIFMYGAFLLLLSYLADSPENEFRLSERSQIGDCIRYIDAHFAEPLPLSRLCDALHLSESALFRLFKRELGISPHKYISERRLIEANKLIAQGSASIEAAALCGWADYSAFYKAYVKKFTVPPSQT